MDDNVYPPSEDTYLLIDALHDDRDMLRNLAKMNTGLLCVEIGCGAGTVTEALLQILQPCPVLAYATDVNRNAVDCASLSGREEEKCFTEFLVGDLAEPFRQRLADVLLFNPPYVPTDDEEFEASLRLRDISAAWAGGARGRVVIDRFLKESLPVLLADNGVAYMVALQANLPDQIAAQTNAAGSFDSRIIKRRRAGHEHLCVVRFFRRPGS